MAVGSIGGYASSYAAASYATFQSSPTPPVAPVSRTDQDGDEGARAATSPDRTSTLPVDPSRGRNLNISV